MDLDAAVLGAGVVEVFLLEAFGIDEGLAFAVAFGGEACGVDAFFDEVGDDGGGAVFGELEVFDIVADVVGVAFDADVEDAGGGVEDGGDLVEGGEADGFDGGFAGVEEDLFVQLNFVAFDGDGGFAFVGAAVGVVDAVNDFFLVGAFVGALADEGFDAGFGDDGVAEAVFVVVEVGAAVIVFELVFVFGVIGALVGALAEVFELFGDDGTEGGVAEVVFVVVGVGAAVAVFEAVHVFGFVGAGVDGVGDFVFVVVGVGAAVGVFELVEVFFFVGALVGGNVEDGVFVVVGIWAAVIVFEVVFIFGLFVALIDGVEEAVAVGVAVLVLVADGGEEAEFGSADALGDGAAAADLGLEAPDGVKAEGAEDFDGVIGAIVAGVGAGGIAGVDIVGEFGVTEDGADEAEVAGAEGDFGGEAPAQELVVDVVGDGLGVAELVADVGGEFEAEGEGEIEDKARFCAERALSGEAALVACGEVEGGGDGEAEAAEFLLVEEAEFGGNADVTEGEVAHILCERAVGFAFLGEDEGDDEADIKEVEEAEADPGFDFVLSVDECLAGVVVEVNDFKGDVGVVIEDAGGEIDVLGGFNNIAAVGIKDIAILVIGRFKLVDLEAVLCAGCVGENCGGPDRGEGADSEDE